MLTRAGLNGTQAAEKALDDAKSAVERAAAAEAAAELARLTAGTTVTKVL